MSGNLSLKKLRTALAAAALLAALGTGSGQARDGHDHDLARRALEAGEVLPLRTILERIEREYPGQVMEVGLERKDERWIYEIKLLRTGGTLVKLRIDARDGAVLGVAERDGHERPGPDNRHGGGR